MPLPSFLSSYADPTTRPRVGFSTPMDRQDFGPLASWPWKPGLRPLLWRPRAHVLALPAIRFNIAKALPIRAPVIQTRPIPRGPSSFHSDSVAHCLLPAAGSIGLRSVRIMSRGAKNPSQVNSESSGPTYTPCEHCDPMPRIAAATIDRRVFSSPVEAIRKMGRRLMTFAGKGDTLAHNQQTLHQHQQPLNHGRRSAGGPEIRRMSRSNPRSTTTRALSSAPFC